MSAPLGVFDSGIGGISILIEIRKALPNENLIYFADSAHCPYGTKTVEEIRERSLRITDFLISRNAKAVVVACNTACSAGLDQVRQRNPETPIIGVEPAVKPAHDLTRNGKIGILSTNLTLNGKKFSSLVDKFGNGVKLLTQPAPGLADLVEKGEIYSNETRELLGGYLRPLMEEGIDTLILGCTHYPFLSPVIREICGDGVKLLDTGEAVARQTGRVLQTKKLASNENFTGTVSFYTTGDPATVKDVLDKLWPEKIDTVMKTEI